MEAKPRDGCSVTIPQLLGNDEKQHKLRLEEAEGVDSIGCHSITGTTSFFKTCFNGLNALSGLLIPRCMDIDTSIRSYPDIGERAFGTKGRIFVSFIMNSELYLVATSFLIVEGDNLCNLFPDMGVLEIFGLRIGGRQCFVLIVGLIILPTVWLNSISFLSYISATGVLASFLILDSILWAGALDGIGFQENGMLLNWNGIPTSVSLFPFCY
ncbi:unnamed protein product [Ilex paraguariensis]|uniref:Amino acid transporter transmembrane domain-containing protein n=1 Tax=Ilex paraguariensis TaxID=185542 RepID=A0ABC8UYB4_9AQUA